MNEKGDGVIPLREYFPLGIAIKMNIMIGLRIKLQGLDIKKLYN